MTAYANKLRNQSVVCDCSVPVLSGLEFTLVLFSRDRFTPEVCLDVLLRVSLSVCSAVVLESTENTVVLFLFSFMELVSIVYISLYCSF